MKNKLDLMFESDFVRVPRQFIRKFNLNTAVMLSEIYSELKREIYVARLSEITGVSKHSCEAEIKRIMKKNQKKMKLLMKQK